MEKSPITSKVSVNYRGGRQVEAVAAYSVTTSRLFHMIGEYLMQSPCLYLRANTPAPRHNANYKCYVRLCFITDMEWVIFIYELKSPYHSTTWPIIE